MSCPNSDLQGGPTQMCLLGPTSTLIKRFIYLPSQCLKSNLAACVWAAVIHFKGKYCVRGSTHKFKPIFKVGYCP